MYEGTLRVATLLLKKMNMKLFTFPSCFAYSDKGMKYMVGKNWQDLFDMVIVQADKPSFFTDKRK